MTRQNLWAGILSSLAFLLMFLLFKWYWLISLLLAVGIFVAVYLISQPANKIGDIDLDNLKNGLEIKDLYVTAQQDLLKMKEDYQALANSRLKDQVQHLIQIADDIMLYLADHPREISKSRHFLEYYFETAAKIINNYHQIHLTHISNQKLEQIGQKTLESVSLLDQIFTKQLEAYHEDKLFALEIETDLLEKTIKLGGDLR
ncbi:5-bromo-4-chloroindolyl phosphate hydrolysis family protein [Ignavigranum ruoffiae]|uniref:5-bromo-4-chloroindolyl phosphate hydrolysis family protein n=1 Tax=Ignavigranum ruoffiae TaxID=89093 RepID=UPI003B00A6FA